MSTASASMEMSASARSRSDTPTQQLDELVGRLKGKAREFAEMSPARRAQLLKSCLGPLSQVAERWVAAAVSAKGLTPNTASEGEEWLAGPVTTARNVRLLVRSLEQIAQDGKPKLPKALLPSADGVTRVEVFPTDAMDGAMMAGLTATVRMQKGLTPDDVRARQAAFYAKGPHSHAHDGRVSLVLGAGNVASIPPMDALYKMFVDGCVCLVKMNPVNEYLMPFYEEGLRPLVSAGYLSFVTGGGDVGAYLCAHPSVDDVHITGSDRTHDLIVWGPPGPERDRRQREDDPVLKKPISSELGCVTPVVIVPARFTDAELDFVSQNVASMVTNNASCNCNAAKMLVTSKGWAQRDDFLRRLRAVLSGVASRKAYYPGAFDRYEKLVGGRAECEKLGPARDGELPWTLVAGLDASGDDTLFNTEPFCPIVSEARIDESDPSAFLDAATTFCNDKLWGTLSAVLIVHPSIERDAQGAAAVERAVANLRYGAVGINHWTGLVYGLVSTPWGAHPSSTMKNIQGGLGWVHNTFMLEGIEKVVLRGPLVMKPKPPWFVTHKNTHRVGQKMFELEVDPSWFKVPAIALAALQG